MNKKVIKKLFAMMLSTSMIISLAACGEKEAEGSTSNSDDVVIEKTESTNQESTNQEPEISTDYMTPYEETLTLSFARYTNGYTTYPKGVTNDTNGYIDLIKDVLNIECVTAFEAEQGGDFDNKLSMSMVSEELPDIIMLTDNAQNFVKEMAEADLIWDLTEIYEAYASDEMKAIYDSYPGNYIWDRAVVDDRIYGIPYAAGLTTSMFWLRQDWIDELGLKVDEDGNGLITREELVMIAKAFIEADFAGTGDTIGIAGTGYDDNALGQLFASFGSYPGNYIVNEDRSVSHGSTLPGTKDALEWLSELYDEGVLDPQFGVRDWNGIQEAVINGKLGILNGFWYQPDITHFNLYVADSEADLVAYGIDNGSGQMNWPISGLSNSCCVVSKSCENPEAAFKIIQLVELYWNNLTTEEKMEVCPQLLAQTQAGMNKFACPINIDVVAVDTLYNKQVVPVFQYLEGELKVEDAPNNAVKNIITVIENRKTGDPIEPAHWAQYYSRMKGLGSNHILFENDLVNAVEPIYYQTQSMLDNYGDLAGFMYEVFTKIIIGELPLEEFDEYVKERNARGDDVICEDLATVN